MLKKIFRRWFVPRCNYEASQESLRDHMKQLVAMDSQYTQLVEINHKQGSELAELREQVSRARDYAARFCPEHLSKTIKQLETSSTTVFTHGFSMGSRTLEETKVELKRLTLVVALHPHTMLPVNFVVDEFLSRLRPALITEWAKEIHQ